MFAKYVRTYIKASKPLKWNHKGIFWAKKSITISRTSMSIRSRFLLPNMFYVAIGEANRI